MSYKRKKSLAKKKFQVKCALDHLLTQGQHNQFEKRKIENFSKRIRLCGTKIGQSDTIGYCNKAICGRCSSRWAELRNEKFIENCGDENIEHFRMITVMLPIQSSIEACFESFNEFRARFPASIRNARNLKKDIITRDQWRDVSMTAGLEIDAYCIDDFDRIGDRKKEDLLDVFKFDRSKFEGRIIYVPHLHGVSHIGEMDDSLLSSRLSPFCVYTDVRRLYNDKSVDVSVGSILGYSGKVEFLTTLRANRRIDWDDEAIVDYISSLINRQGKKSFGISISKYRGNDR